MQRNTVPIAVAALALAVAGCGSDESGKSSAEQSTSTSTTAAAEAGTPVLQALAGGWTRSVTKADIERTQKKRSELGPNQEKPKPQVAIMTFEPGTLTTRDPKATFVVQQDYTADGGTIVIKGYQHPEEGSFCGPEIPQNATYSWKSAGDDLILKATQDPCADRDSTLTGTWKRP